MFYVSPLVDVKEVDLTTTVAAASSSIAGIVIRNPWMGRENTLMFTTTDDEVVSAWGKPTEKLSNYCDILAAIHFHEYGNSLYSVGVRPADATFGGLTSMSSGTAQVSGSFLTMPTTGTPSWTLEDLPGGNIDEFPNSANPLGPMDFISVWRGASANRIRLAVIDADTYDKIVRQRLYSNWPITDYVLGLDAILEKGDNKAFLVMVQFCPQGANTADATNWQTVEVHNVSMDRAALDDQGRSKFAETVINERSAYIRICIDESQKDQAITCSTVNWQTFGGGSDGTANDTLLAEQIEAYRRFENTDELDINILIDADKPETVKSEIIQVCIDRKDCHAIIDCRYESVVNNKGSEVTSLQAYRLGTAPYAADNININSDRFSMYANWGEVYDQYNKKYRWVPLSGKVAGLFANNDELADPWFAPAGLNRATINGVRKLGWNPNQAQRDAIHKIGWNPIVSFAGQGKVVWGQKTGLDKSSAFNRINVRRLFNVVEKSVATAVKYFLFEPNDALTRLSIVNMIEPFLREVQGRRGITSFKIVCDESNNTPARIDANELWVDLLISPTRSAEFIVLRFTATRTGASFSEIASSLDA